MMRAVLRLRARREVARRAAIRRQQRADECAVALRAASGAIGTLKQVWHQAAALDILHFLIFHIFCYNFINFCDL